LIWVVFPFLYQCIYCSLLHELWWRWWFPELGYTIQRCNW
jgi:hypothetical protein